MSDSIEIPARWSSQSGEGDDLFYVEDNGDEGWWVMMKEGSGAMILFTGLGKGMAEQFKERLDAAIVEYLEKRGR